MKIYTKDEMIDELVRQLKSNETSFYEDERGDEPTVNLYGKFYMWRDGTCRDEKELRNPFNPGLWATLGENHRNDSPAIEKTPKQE